MLYQSPHQHRRRFFRPLLIILILCAVATLAACGGSAEAPPAVDPTAVLPTAEVNLGRDEAAVPLGLQPIFRYTVSVSGAVNASTTGTTVIAENTFAAEAGAGDLIFALPPEPAVGAYAIGGSASLFASEMFSGANAESGTLTVSAVEPLVASFAITLNSATGQSVTVNGTMVEMLYNLTLAFSGAITLDAAYEASYTPVYLTLAAQDSSRRATIDVYFPSGVTAGTYPLAASSDNPPPEGTLEALVTLDNGTRFEGGTGEGTITFTQVGATASGSLTFTVTTPDGGETVSVTATFTDVPGLSISRGLIDQTPV